MSNPTIQPNDARELQRMRRKLDQGIKPGPGVRIVNRPDGVTISVIPQSRPPPAPPAVVRMKVTTAADSNYPNVLLAKVWDGTNDPADDDPEIPVKLQQSH